LKLTNLVVTGHATAKESGVATTGPRYG